MVDLQARCEMLRALIHKTAWLMDKDGRSPYPIKFQSVTTRPTACAARRRILPCRYTAAWATPRYKPFEHIYRHHCRYRITEGADEIQMRRVAGYLFGFMNQQKPKGVS